MGQQPEENKITESKVGKGEPIVQRADRSKSRRARRLKEPRKERCQGRRRCSREEKETRSVIKVDQEATKGKRTTWRSQWYISLKLYYNKWRARNGRRRRNHWRVVPLGEVEKALWGLGRLQATSVEEGRNGGLSLNQLGNVYFENLEMQGNNLTKADDGDRCEPPPIRKEGEWVEEPSIEQTPPREETLEPEIEFETKEEKRENGTRKEIKVEQEETKVNTELEIVIKINGDPKRKQMGRSPHHKNSRSKKAQPWWLSKNDMKKPWNDGLWARSSWKDLLKESRFKRLSPSTKIQQGQVSPIKRQKQKPKRQPKSARRGRGKESIHESPWGWFVSLMGLKLHGTWVNVVYSDNPNLKAALKWAGMDQNNGKMSWDSPDQPSL